MNKQAAKIFTTECRHKLFALSLWVNLLVPFVKLAYILATLLSRAYAVPRPLNNDLLTRWVVFTPYFAKFAYNRQKNVCRAY